MRARRPPPEPRHSQSPLRLAPVGCPRAWRRPAEGATVPPPGPGRLATRRIASSVSVVLSLAMASPTATRRPSSTDSSVTRPPTSGATRDFGRFDIPRGPRRPCAVAVAAADAERRDRRENAEQAGRTESYRVCLLHRIGSHHIRVVHRGQITCRPATGRASPAARDSPHRRGQWSETLGRRCARSGGVSRRSRSTAARVPRFHRGRAAD